MKSVLNVHWKDWCWSWSSNTLAIWCKEPTHWKRPWCLERLKAEGEGDDRGWDGWMASLTQWTWVWVSFRSWWWTGRPDVLQFMGSQRVWHDWATERTYGQESLRWNGITFIVNKRVQNAVLGCNLKNNRMISVNFQGKPFNITVVQVYSPTTDAEEVEVDWFYEDLQGFLELTPKKMYFSSQEIRMQK